MRVATYYYDRDGPRTGRMETRRNTDDDNGDVKNGSSGDGGVKIYSPGYRIRPADDGGLNSFQPLKSESICILFNLTYCVLRIARV